MASSKGFFRGSYVSMFPFKDGGAGMFIQNQLRVVGFQPRLDLLSNYW